MIRKKDKKDPEINSSSMADIVFLLLIFFLVTTTVDTDKGISLVLPDKGEGKEINKKNITNIFINAGGQVLMDDELIDVRRINDQAKMLLQQNNKMIFSVKTHTETKYGVYIDVLDQLKRAKAKRISIAEPEG